MREEEFKVGSWYKLSSGKCVLHGDWYVKFKGINGNLIMSDEYIYNTNYTPSFDKGTNFGDMTDYNYKLISLQEIRQYLPDGHKDKFSPISKEQKQKLLNLIREI